VAHLRAAVKSRFLTSQRAVVVVRWAYLVQGGIP
jgi:hypothetical protein